MSTQHLLLISLGPIQDFIASARRCQDLWFGSWLLSELARVTAEAVQQTGTTVIFPAGLAANADRPGVANLVLALVEGDPAEIARQADKAMRARLSQVATVAWKDVPPRWFKRSTALAQLDELMELSWVCVPSTGEYEADREKLYGRMAALKNTRLWTQPTWDSGVGVPKSSLDGERESVIDEAVFKALTAEQRRRAFGLKGAERLCGVGLLKRKGVDDADIFESKPPFHSTSHLAMVPTIERLSSAKSRVQVYLEDLETLGLPLNRFEVGEGGPPTLNGYDGVLLMESRLEDHFTTEAPGFAERSKAERDVTLTHAKSALRKLLKNRIPCPYYAFLLADGDNMGKAIDGINSIEGHLALGKALNTFASDCRPIVEKHHGSLIFAGGDDVLALLPLHTAVACARELRERFIQVGHGTSLSVGLGFSHCREPMSEARALAKRAEGLAKAHPGKDALGIIVAKRSGGDLSLVGGWSDSHALDERIEKWIEILDAEGLAAKAAHDLEEVAAHYDDVPDKAARADEIISLARQVLSRKRARGGEAMDTELHQLLRSRIGGEDPAARVRELSVELQVARQLHKAHLDAAERT